MEINPGPNGYGSDRNALLDGQREILEKIGAVERKFDDYITQSDMRLNTMEIELKRLAANATHIESCEKVVEELSSAIATVHMKLEYFEQRSRRNNIVIFGVQEKDDETPTS